MLIPFFYGFDTYKFDIGDSGDKILKENAQLIKFEDSIEYGTGSEGSQDAEFTAGLDSVLSSGRHYAIHVEMAA